jgi:hypothetical protein
VRVVCFFVIAPVTNNLGFSPALYPFLPPSPFHLPSTQRDLAQANARGARSHQQDAQVRAYPCLVPFHERTLTVRRAAHDVHIRLSDPRRPGGLPREASGGGRPRRPEEGPRDCRALGAGAGVGCHPEPRCARGQGQARLERRGPGRGPPLEREEGEGVSAQLGLGSGRSRLAMVNLVWLLYSIVIAYFLLMMHVMRLFLQFDWPGLYLFYISRDRVFVFGVCRSLFDLLHPSRKSRGRTLPDHTILALLCSA